jgi:hypothetical protein
MELVSVVQLSLRPDKTQVQMHILAMEYELCNFWDSVCQFLFHICLEI